jgi:hypothetical protein
MPYIGMPVDLTRDSIRIYACTQLLKASKTDRVALSSLRNFPLCSIDEYIEASRAQALKDVEFLGTLGFHLQESATSPAVQQCGSVDSSRPTATSSPLVGAKGKRKKRSGGTPLKAKKGPGVGKPNRPVGSSDSPSDEFAGLLGSSKAT